MPPNFLASKFFGLQIFWPPNFLASKFLIGELLGKYLASNFFGGQKDKIWRPNFMARPIGLPIWGSLHKLEHDAGKGSGNVCQDLAVQGLHNTSRSAQIV
jgi:hypothetical protein